MKNNEYIERNLKGFEGDELIFKEIKKIAKQNNIKVAIETGTYWGGSTKRLAEIFSKTHSIEVDVNNAQKAIEYLIFEAQRVQITIGDSSKDLLEIIKSYKQEKMFFFLDAHWGNHCPLLDELAQICQSGKKAFISIHDFFNPNHSDFGYDEYKGQRLDFEYIKNSLSEIYPNGYTYYYNEKAEGAKRGVIYILPK